MKRLESKFKEFKSSEIDNPLQVIGGWVERIKTTTRTIQNGQQTSESKDCFIRGNEAWNTSEDTFQKQNGDWTIGCGFALPDPSDGESNILIEGIEYQD